MSDPMPKIREIICNSCSEPARECPEHWSADKAEEFFRMLAEYDRMILEDASDFGGCDSCGEPGRVACVDDGQACDLVYITGVPN